MDTTRSHRESAGGRVRRSEGVPRAGENRRVGCIGALLIWQFATSTDRFGRWFRRPSKIVALAVVAFTACSTEGPEALRERPERIVAIAPSSAEALYFLGLGDRVVGVGNYVQWPPSWSDKPRLGGLFDPDLEQLAALRPDLAVLLPSEERLEQQLQQLGVEVLTVPSETVADVETGLLAIGNRCGVHGAAEAAVTRLRTELATKVLPRPLEAVLVVGREPGRLAGAVVAGPGTYFHELLGYLGVENSFADSALAYPQMSLEEIVARRPDAIVELQPIQVNESRIAALGADWGKLLSADDQCWSVVDGEHVMIPGPRLPRLLVELRRSLLPCALQEPREEG